MTLRQQGWEKVSRACRGLVRRYIEKLTALSRAQVTRLISLYAQGEAVRPAVYQRRQFPVRYTGADIELLAVVDDAHDTLKRPATKKILERDVEVYGDRRFERLAKLSVSHLYRLRKSRTYRQRRVVYQATRPSPVSIGERRAPRSEGRPGYLRVDTVHQGDLDGVKGIYHINAVDEVTRGRWRERRRRSARLGCSRCLSESWCSFRSGSVGFIPITARNISITR